MLFKVRITKPTPIVPMSTLLFCADEGKKLRSVSIFLCRLSFSQRICLPLGVCTGKDGARNRT